MRGDRRLAMGIEAGSLCVCVVCVREGDCSLLLNYWINSSCLHTTNWPQVIAGLIKTCDWQREVRGWRCSHVDRSVGRVGVVGWGQGPLPTPVGQSRTGQSQIIPHDPKVTDCHHGDGRQWAKLCQLEYKLALWTNPKLVLGAVSTDWESTQTLPSHLHMTTVYTASRVY